MAKDIDKLIEKVKNVSVYTRDERKEWIEKIKRGDKKAIESAEKLLKGKSPSEEEIGLSYTKKGNRIVRKSSSRGSSSKNVNIDLSFLNKQPFIKDEFAEATNQIIEREVKKLEEGLRTIQQQKQMYEDVLKQNKDVYYFVDEKGNEVILTKEDVKKRIERLNKEEEEITSLYNMWINPQTKQYLYDRMSQQKKELEEKDIKQTLKESKNPLVKAGTDFLGTIYSAKQFLYRAVKENPLSKITGGSFILEKALTKEQKKRLEEEKYDIVAKKIREAKEVGLKYSDIPKLLPKAVAKTGLETVDDLTFGLTNLSDKIKDEKVDVLLGGNVIKEGTKAFVSGYGFGLGFKTLSQALKKLRYGEKLAKGSDILLTASLLAYTGKNIYDNKDNIKDWDDVIAQGLVYAGAFMGGYSVSKPLSFKVKKPSIKILEIFNKNKKKYKPFRQSKDIEFVDRIETDEYIREIWKVNGEYRNIFFITTKKNNLAFIQKDKDMRTFDVVKINADGSTTKLKSDLKIDSIFRKIREISNRKLKNEIDKGKVIIRKYEMKREGNNVVGYYRLKMVDKGEVNKYKQLGWEVYGNNVDFNKLKNRYLIEQNFNTKEVILYPKSYEQKVFKKEKKTTKKNDGYLEVKQENVKVEQVKSGNSLLLVKQKQKVETKAEVKQKVKEKVKQKQKTKAKTKQKQKVELVKLRPLKFELKSKIKTDEIIKLKLKDKLKLDLKNELKLKLKEKEKLKTKQEEDLKFLTQLRLREKVKSKEKLKTKTATKTKLKPLGFPKLDLDLGDGKRESIIKPIKFKKSKEKYKPSLLALSLNIKTKEKPKDLLGIGIRPIIKKNKKV